MKPTVSITLAIAVFAVFGAVCADFSPAAADELNDLRSNQAAINSRIDQLAKPTGPQTSDQPTLDTPPGGPSPGSFPRSFLIPGTDTSIRVGGFIDGTGSYSRQ